MDSETKNTQYPDVRKGPDWRNTIFQFTENAVKKFKLKSQEIAIFCALFACAKNRGRGYGIATIDSRELMARSGISDYRAFKKARDKLAHLNIVEIVKKGNLNNGKSKYSIKLLGKPTKKGGNIETKIQE